MHMAQTRLVPLRNVITMQCPQIKWILLFPLGVPLFQALSQETYFYKGRPFGSEALYNPVSFILNSTFDIIQLDGYSREIFDFPYRQGFTNVWRNFVSPFGPISRYGWKNFIHDQVFPLEPAKKNAAWWPNYHLHLIGGGMSYTALREWYRAHDYPNPVLLSIATKAVDAFVNAAVENGKYQGDDVDPIADLWIFDPAGILLFSSEGVNRFFSEELNLADWSLQASFLLSPVALHNNGQCFSVKWKFPFSERWFLFYFFGMNGLIGLSYKMSGGSAVSVGGGMRGKQLVLLDQATNQRTLDLVWNAGVFYDQDNSLMASLFVSGLTDYSAILNIYPGMLRFGAFSPGIWIAIGRDLRLLAGVTTVWSPGLGFRAQ
jgi:hypothetical protein